jgi:LysM repeat protein
MGVVRLIETIYSNENGDNEGTSRIQPAFKMPKNIRQIGKSNAAKKIYIEDYVMSYIRQLAGEDYVGCNLAVLVGQCVKLDNCRNIFISGAVKIKDMESTDDLVFTNETWTQIYEDIKKYFSELEIVGWFIGGPGYALSEEEKILKTHVDNFAGQDKVLLTYDSMEKEESFLCYENSRLCRQEGYYIYYEKNEEMQTYIIDHKSGESCEADYEDKVSKNIRAVIQDKQTEKEDNKSVTRLMYAAGTLLAIIVLIIGAAMLRNYDQMKNMQDTLNYLTKNMEEVQAIFSENGKGDATEIGDDQAVVTKGATDNNKASEEDGLDVEVMPGNVEPQAEDANRSEEDSSATDADQNEDAQNVSDNDKGSTSDKELADGGRETSAKGSTKSSAETAVSYYIVKEGDTLAGISFNLYHTYTKVDKIMELNGITDQDVIYYGQKLIVP